MTGDITGLLHAWSLGDRGALDRMLPLVYAELRRVAGRELRDTRAGQPLDPTTLVHELYLRLVNQQHATWENRAQFYGVAATLMRRILVDHARARHAEKRGGATTLLGMDAAEHAAGRANAAADVLAVHEALERLSARDPDQARLVDLRFFGGLTVEEAAHVLGRSSRTVKREWRLARAWLYRELHGER
jgi:RNA polymerase sigma-70 factor, ECF subfamily